MQISYGNFWLVYGGWKLQDLKSLREYGIAKDASISLIAKLRDGARVWVTPSSSQPNTFKEVLKLGHSSLNPKDLLGPTFVVDQATDTPSLEVKIALTNFMVVDYEQQLIICHFNGFWPLAYAL